MRPIQHWPGGARLRTMDSTRPRVIRSIPPYVFTNVLARTEEIMVATPQPAKSASLPPRWFIRVFWVAQRALYSITRGRLGLRPATADTWGMLRLRTVGRRTGRERVAILGYFEDGPDLVTMAMNGWAEPEPAWWLNLQAQPDVVVDLPSGPRPVHAHAATAAERPRLWAMLATHDKGLDAYAARRSVETAVVILSPRAA